MSELTLSYAQHLRDLVKQAGRVDRECKVFGSSKHRYCLNPVLSDEIVSKYEEKNHIKLPSEYKFFITQVGNGGAGPDYGIYPLVVNNPCRCDMKPPFISSKLTKDEWKEKLRPLEDEDCPDDEFDRMEEELSSGVYALGTKGCTFENITVSSGEDENRVFYINFDWDEDAMPYDTEMNFLTWYEHFFEEIINGNDVSGYGYRIIGSQQELISQFEESQDHTRRSKLLNSFFRFRAVSQETLLFFRNLSEEEFPTYKLALLLRYDVKEGVALFDRFLDEKPLAAIEESANVPKDQLPQFFDRMRDLLYTIENGSENISRYSSAHSLLMQRMSECPQMRAADIAQFLKKDGITERDLQDAFYYMGEAVDKIKELDTFIDAMENGPYWAAHSALQAVSDVCSVKLQEVLPKLWERYKEDSCMTANLKVAFRTNHLVVPQPKYILHD